jgi:GT2 family glycosyltransferase
MIQGHGAPALVEARSFPREDPKDYDLATGETHWCSDRCLVIPRFLFELTGGFDEALPQHAAVIDFSWRVWQSGGRCLVASLALVHGAAVDSAAGTPQEKLLLESGRVLAEKWQNPKFRLYCEAALIEHGHFRGIPELPPLPATTQQTPHPRVDFAHELFFAPARW